MQDSEWVLIDTETTGLSQPIYVIEIAAQKMRGWEPVGEPYHAYLNHNVRIPSAAIAIHRLTNEFIAENGRDPKTVHTELIEFMGSLPVVSHPLNYDWDRCLLPEWERLGIEPQAKRGFCALLLARRVLPEAESKSLDALRELYSINEGRAHSANGDVATLVALFTQHYGPRLEEAGINTYDEVEAFSTATPIKSCHARLGAKAQAQITDEKEEPPVPPPSQWYCFDHTLRVYGPFKATYVDELASGSPCHVWTPGLSDWVVSHEYPVFVEQARVAK